MLCDFDDFCEYEHRLDLLRILKEANPQFKVTLFAIPALGSDEFWASVPGWCELAVHGWRHPHSREAEHWTYEETMSVLAARPPGFVKGFKAPGWMISDETYRALLDSGWWVADHWGNEHRRPKGLRAHVISHEAAVGSDPDHWHGHIPNVCGNGIEETFPALLKRVLAAESFEWMSEVV